jgi:hypothetical protein
MRVIMAGLIFPAAYPEANRSSIDNTFADSIRAAAENSEQMFLKVSYEK